MEAIVSLEAATVGAVGTGEAVILEGAAIRWHFFHHGDVFFPQEKDSAC